MPLLPWVHRHQLPAPAAMLCQLLWPRRLQPRPLPLQPWLRGRGLRNGSGVPGGLRGSGVVPRWALLLRSRLHRTRLLAARLLPGGWVAAADVWRSRSLRARTLCLRGRLVGLCMRFAAATPATGPAGARLGRLGPGPARWVVPAAFLRGAVAGLGTGLAGGRRRGGDPRPGRSCRAVLRAHVLRSGCMHRRPLHVRARLLGRRLRTKLPIGLRLAWHLRFRRMRLRGGICGRRLLHGPGPGATNVVPERLLWAGRMPRGELRMRAGLDRCRLFRRSQVPRPTGLLGPGRVRRWPMRLRGWLRGLRLLGRDVRDPVRLRLLAPRGLPQWPVRVPSGMGRPRLRGACSVPVGMLLARPVRRWHLPLRAWLGG